MVLLDKAGIDQFADTDPFRLSQPLQIYCMFDVNVYVMYLQVWSNKT